MSGDGNNSRGGGGGSAPGGGPVPNAAPPNVGSAPLRTFHSLVHTARAVKYEHLIAGVSGGVVSTLVLHPLDLLKIRFAVDDGGQTAAKRPQYSGLRQAFKAIFQQEGIPGLYKGVTPNVAGAGSSWGFYFLFYNTIKTEMQEGNSKMQLSPMMHMIAATQAGIFTLAMTNPIWVVKTRLCLQYEPAPAAAAAAATVPETAATTRYNGMMDALYKIAKYEGIRGLYKGFVPGLWGVSHGAIQFMVYEEMKTEYNHYKKQPIDSKLGSGEYIFFAACSKLIAAVTTYPYQVVRARLQDHHSSYDGAIDCVRKTLRQEGLSGFYKGLTPNLARVVPATALTFVVYEKVSGYIGSWRSGEVPTDDS